MTKRRITKETLKKAGRTFVQTALGYIVVNIVAVDFTGDKEVMKSALIGLGVSALSAGIAAVMNLEEVKDIIDEATTEENPEINTDEAEE